MDIRHERTYYLSLGLLIGLLFALANQFGATVPGGIVTVVSFIWAVIEAQGTTPNQREG